MFTLNEMDKYLESHKLPKLTQVERENLNKTYNKKRDGISNKEPRQRKAQAQMASLVNQLFTVELTPVLHVVF